MLSLEANFMLEMIKNNFILKKNDQIAYQNLNQDYLFELLQSNRLFPNVYRAIKGQLTQDSFYHKEYKKHCTGVQQAKNEISRIYTHAEKEKIRFLVVKGIPLSKIIYDDENMRFANDIDILVDEDDALRMDHLLRELGYVQPVKVNWDTLSYEKSDLLDFPIMRLRHTNHFFEYYIFNNPIKKVELHKYLYFLKPHIKEILWNTSRYSINESIEINIPDLFHLTILLFVNAFQNSETLYALQGRTTLRDYVDLYYFIKRFFSAMDWNHVINLMIEYEVLDIAVSVLNNLCKIYDNDLEISSCFLLFSKYYGNATSSKTFDIGLSFIEKMLDLEKRKKETFHYLKSAIFDESKTQLAIKNSKNPFLSDFIIHENRLKLDIRYYYKMTKDSIIFSVYFENKLEVDFDKYMLQTTLVNDSIDASNILYTNIDIIKNNNKYYASYINSPIMRDQNVLRNSYQSHMLPIEYTKIEDQGILLKVKLPFKYINDYIDVHTRFAYEVNLFQYVAKEIYHFVELQAPVILDAQVLSFI